jgi:hypothetical protein
MAAKLTRLTHKIAIQRAPSGRELYHLQFSLQVASPETFGYTLVHPCLERDSTHEPDVQTGRDNTRLKSRDHLDRHTDGYPLG